MSRCIKSSNVHYAIRDAISTLMRWKTDLPYSAWAEISATIKELEEASGICDSCLKGECDGK